MNVRTNIPHKLRMQIIHCIELLGEDYTSLNYTIDIYINRDRLEYEHRNKPFLSNETYEQILNGEVQPPGQIIPDKKIIKLYLFNLENIENENKRKIELVANLFHEVRHAWQFKHELFLDEQEIEDLDNNIGKYYNLPSEKDAYLFQEEQINRFKNSIVEIMAMTKSFKDYKLKKEIRDLMNLN